MTGAYSFPAPSKKDVAAKHVHCTCMVNIL